MLVEESDAANLAESNQVADEDLVGTEALAGFDFDADNAARKIGYIGSKRYVRVTVTPSGNGGNAPLAGFWILYGPRSSPTANPPA